MFINLREKTENLRKNLRKSYKSLINKEKRKIKFYFLIKKYLMKNILMIG